VLLLQAVQVEPEQAKTARRLPGLCWAAQLALLPEQE
jgi:hypothetical protein